jgi:multiple sugar transport system ATP-binding protein
MSVYDNMAFGLEMRNTPRDEIDRRVRRAAGLLRIEAYLQRKPKALSGGQRQRVAMGRAMVRDPKVFLFDEPLSNLDAKLRSEVRTEIKALSQQLRTTMVFVTHDQVEAMTMADRIVVMKGGAIQQIGVPEDVYKEPANQFVAGFIGSPTMNFFDVAVNADADAVRLKDGTRIGLPASAMAALRRSGGPTAVLGVRPEHWQLLPSDQPGLKTKVSVVEPLGSDTLVHFHCDGNLHVARVQPELRVKPGDAITLGVAADKAHLFDVRDGAALR